MMKKFFKTYALHITGTLLGISVFLITMYIWKDYFNAEHKFSVEATLISVDTDKKTVPKKKTAPDYTISNRDKTYYEYELTWMFENPESHKIYKFIHEAESSTANMYHAGQKQTLFIYYNENEADYETAEPFQTIIFLAVGVILIIIPIWDITSKAVRRRKQRKNQPKTKSHRSYVPGYDYLNEDKHDKTKKD